MKHNAINSITTRALVASAICLSSATFAAAVAATKEGNTSASNTTMQFKKVSEHGMSTVNQHQRDRNKKAQEKSTGQANSRELGGSAGPRSSDDYDVIDHARTGTKDRAQSSARAQQGGKKKPESAQLPSEPSVDHTDPEAHIHAGPHTRK